MRAPAPGQEFEWFTTDILRLRQHSTYQTGVQPPGDDPTCWLADHSASWRPLRREDFGPLDIYGALTPNQLRWDPITQPRASVEQYRVRVETRFRRTCIYCERLGGERDPDGTRWHLDHYIALGIGGIDAEFNLVLACRRCNERKGRNPWVPAMTVGSYDEVQQEMLIPAA